MRRKFIPVPFAIVLLATVLSVPVFPVEFSSRVDRVVLYPDMAEVTRVVEVDRPEATVVLPGLTPNLLADTLSARVASGGERITGVSAEDLFRTEPVDERVGELTRRIEELSDGKRRAEEEAAAARREKELLERGVLAIYAPGEATKDGEKGRSPRLSVSEVDAALSLYRTRVEALDGSVFANDRKARDLEKKIAAARRELDKIRNPRPTQEKVVRIDLAPAGRCLLAVTYRVPAAGFVPRYNARLVPGAGTLSLELVAEAWQRTGEDWKEATLTFSTARPGNTAQLPPLPPWELDFYQPPVARPMMKMRSEAADAALSGAFAPEAKEEAVLPFPARRFASFETTLEGRHALGGNGEKKAFLLVRQEQKTAVAWRAVPKMAEGAYLAANGRNETGLPVFSAPAALFLEDAYVGRGHIPDIPEGEEFRIDFGQDPGVRIQRKERERKREEGGVFAKVKRTRFRYEITAQNFRKEAVPLTVLDQVPFPRHKEIVVKDVEITGGGKTGEQGEITWELSLAAGEKKVLGFSFTVEYPADKEIHGL
jgi:uncharacterized protein (TIGR02231 family)